MKNPFVEAAINAAMLRTLGYKTKQYPKNPTAGKHGRTYPFYSERECARRRRQLAAKES